MRIFGIPVIVNFGNDMENQVAWEDADHQAQVEWTNAVVYTTHDKKGREIDWDMENYQETPTKQHWWQR